MSMTTPLMDIRILAAVTVIGAGIFAGEEILSFVLRRIARRAGAAPTVTRDRGHLENHRSRPDTL